MDIDLILMLLLLSYFIPQICLAVEKERNARLEELQRTELELEKLKDERDTATSGSTADLENKERENERLRNAIDRLKKVCKARSCLFGLLYSTFRGLYEPAWFACAIS